MGWPESVGIEDKLMLVETVLHYLGNIKNNLENHLNWNIDHISMTISSLELGALEGMRRIRGIHG